MPESSDELLQTLLRFSQAVRSGRLIWDLRCIAEAAQMTAPGCAGASVALALDGPTTEVSTHRFVLDADLVSYRQADGPGMADMPDRSAAHCTIVPLPEGFEPSPPAAGELGVTAILSIPVFVDDEVVGSLSLHSLTPGAFDESSQSIGTSLAGRIGVALTNSAVLRAGRDILALVTKRAAESEVVAQAQGVLMELYDCSSAQAVALVDRASQANGELPVLVAERILETLRGARGGTRSG